MTVANKNVAIKEYKVNKASGESHSLNKSEKEKDIGVIIDQKLKFNDHVATKVNKANSILGIIRRSYKYLDEQTFKHLYKALVRPHLEYANATWSPKQLNK